MADVAGITRRLSTRDFGEPSRKYTVVEHEPPSDVPTGNDLVVPVGKHDTPTFTHLPFTIDGSVLREADKLSEKQFYAGDPFASDPTRAEKPTTESGDSSRKDAGKDAGFWLLPYVGLRELARVYKIGANKYEPRGWEKGMAWSRIVDPMFRHLFKWLKGEKYDQTDGQHHLASVAWACFALMEYEETHPELDDLRRPNA